MMVISRISIQFIVNRKCKCICYSLRHFLLLCFLLIIGGIEQNPGPGKKSDKDRRPQQSHLSLRSSLLGQRKKSYDVNNSHRSSSSDEEHSGVTQLLSSVNAHMNTNMSYIQKNLNDLNTKVDDVTCTCEELRVENEKLRNQNKDLLRKIAIFEARLDDLELTSKTDDKGLESPKSEKEEMAMTSDYEFVKEMFERISIDKLPISVTDNTNSVSTDEDGKLSEKGKQLTGTTCMNENETDVPVSANTQRHHSMLSKKSRNANIYSESTKRHLKQTEIKTDWTLPVLPDRNIGEQLTVDQTKTDDFIQDDLENYEKSNASLPEMEHFTKCDLPVCGASDKIPHQRLKQYDRKTSNNSKEDHIKKENTIVDGNFNPYSKPVKNKTKVAPVEENVCKNENFTANSGTVVINEFDAICKEIAERASFPEALTHSGDKIYRSHSLFAKTTSRSHKTPKRVYSTPLFKFSNSNNKEFTAKSSNKNEEKVSSTLPASFTKQVGV